MFKKLLPILALSTLTSFTANAYILNMEGSYLYDFISSGEGCAPDTYSTTMTADGSKISILFNNFIADSMDDERRGRKRTSCDMRFTMHVPSGYSASLVKMDFRGYRDISPGGYGALNTEYFFAGQRGPVNSTQWGKEDEWDSGNYFVEGDLLISTQVWSVCGSDVIIGANSSLVAYKGFNEEASMVILDSLDTSVETLFQYQLQWKACNE